MILGMQLTVVIMQNMVLYWQIQFWKKQISTALIIADKTDVRRSRVREEQKSTFDIHDRVNYAVTKSSLIYSNENKAFTLDLKLDTDICTMYEYFEIFLNRMMMCRGAADLLGVKFELTANGSKIL